MNEVAPDTEELLARVAPRRAGVCAGNFQFNNIFDNAAAHADLDFRYSVCWETGVQRMVNWLDAHQRVENSDDDTLEDRVIAAWRELSERMAAEA